MGSPEDLLSERLQLHAAEVLQSMASGVMLVDAEGRVEYANPAAAGMAGLQPEDIVGQLVADPAWQLTDAAGTVLAYEDLPVPTALRERRAVRGVELGVPTLAGVMRWMRVSAQPLFEPDGTLRGAVVTTEDVTEQHNLADRLLQSQKIEGIGQLAGGMAHDFNNLLTVIIGNAELAARRPEDAADEIAEILDAANRGASLTRQILTFARQQVVQARAVHLDHLIEEVESLLQRAVGEGIVLRRASDDDLWPVRVDTGQMEQVLVNMVINARDAMPRGGSLLIETRNTLVGVRQAQRRAGVEAGEFVLLSITDTGTGMRPEMLTRIFDPFFTTKPLGSGTGLGLSICHGVVKQARGFIDVETEVGRGTTFKIYLPRTSDEPMRAEARTSTLITGGKGTILLVEDQDAVRSLVERALTGYGYRVLSASSGRHALELQERASRIDLVLTDMVMPEMSGVELANILRQRLPGLPVLYMTGYVDAGSAALLAPDEEENLLLKPFTPMQLLERVQQILSHAARAGTASAS
jgi:two-component system cell cycle sensor histidine kinase/response regulator CckA